MVSEVLEDDETRRAGGQADRVAVPLLAPAHAFSRIIRSTATVEMFRTIYLVPEKPIYREDE
jgi:hypothetical protein